jgi:hypothetical protein
LKRLKKTLKTERHEPREEKNLRRKTKHLLPREKRKKNGERKKWVLGNYNWQLRPDGNSHRPDGKKKTFFFFFVKKKIFSP